MKIKNFCDRKFFTLQLYMTLKIQQQDIRLRLAILIVSHFHLLLYYLGYFS